eukprot:3720074-Prymnesium_polylepis.2
MIDRQAIYVACSEARRMQHTRNKAMRALCRGRLNALQRWATPNGEAGGGLDGKRDFKHVGRRGVDCRAHVDRQRLFVRRRSFTQLQPFAAVLYEGYVLYAPIGGPGDICTAQVECYVDRMLHVHESGCFSGRRLAERHHHSSRGDGDINQPHWLDTATSRTIGCETHVRIGWIDQLGLWALARQALEDCALDGMSGACTLRGRAAYVELLLVIGVCLAAALGNDRFEGCRGCQSCSATVVHWSERDVAQQYLCRTHLVEQGSLTQVLAKLCMRGKEQRTSALGPGRHAQNQTVRRIG